MRGILITAVPLILIHTIIYFAMKPTEKKQNPLILYISIASLIASVVCAILPSMERFIGPVEDAWLSYVMSAIFFCVSIAFMLAYCNEKLDITDDAIIYRNWLRKTIRIQKSDIAEWKFTGFNSESNPFGGADVKIKLTNGKTVLIGQTVGGYKELLLFLGEFDFDRACPAEE